MNIYIPTLEEKISVYWVGNYVNTNVLFKITQSIFGKYDQYNAYNI